MLIAILVGAGLTVMLLLNHQQAEALTVSEVIARAGSPPGRQVRVEGRVAPGSINWNNQTRVMSFVLTDDGESLPVLYRGVVPGNFKPGAEMVVEGSYSPGTAFEAESFGSRASLCDLCH